MKDPNYGPVYCALYPEFAAIARKHGYAMAIHGSLAKDLDLICVPWVEKTSLPQDVVDEIVKSFSIKQINGWALREHNRMVTTLSISFGECYIDLSFTPRLNPTAVQP